MKSPIEFVLYQFKFYLLVLKKLSSSEQKDVVLFSIDKNCHSVYVKFFYLLYLLRTLSIIILFPYCYDNNKLSDEYINLYFIVVRHFSHLENLYNQFYSYIILLEETNKNADNKVNSFDSE